MAPTNAHSSWLSTLDIVQSAVRSSGRWIWSVRDVPCRGVSCTQQDRVALPNTAH